MVKSYAKEINDVINSECACDYRRVREGKNNKTGFQIVRTDNGFYREDA